MTVSVPPAALSCDVVIPAWNEAGNILRCIGAVQASCAAAGVAARIIVVDNLSTDATRDLAAQAGAEVLAMTRKVSIAALRNRGAAACSGDIIAFLDADMEPPPSWMAALQDHFAAGGADAVGFVEQVPDSAPWFARRWAERSAVRRRAVRKTDFLPTRSLTVRRSLFLAVGGFDEGLITAEDKDLTMRLVRAGGVAMSDPSFDAPFLHWGFEPTLGVFVRKEFWRQGRNLAMLRKHGVSARTLRLPLVAAAHVLWPLAPLAALLAGKGVLALLALWFVPAVVLSARGWRHGPVWLAQVTFLNWLRLVVAGTALAREATRLALGRSDGR